jgi:tetratricopeptide (TPR) repeat protein
VLVLRATLRQRSHQFDAALVDLAAVLNTNPRNAQARLTRATVLQVQGAYDAAREDCHALASVAPELVGTACLSEVDALTGYLEHSYRQLLAVSERHSATRSALQGWVLVSLAEMAERAGMIAEADAHFRAALDAGSGVAAAVILTQVADRNLTHPLGWPPGNRRGPDGWRGGGIGDPGIASGWQGNTRDRAGDGELAQYGEALSA